MNLKSKTSYILKSGSRIKVIKHSGEQEIHTTKKTKIYSHRKISQFPTKYEPVYIINVNTKDYSRIIANKSSVKVV